MYTKILKKTILFYSNTVDKKDNILYYKNCQEDKIMARITKEQKKRLLQLLKFVAKTTAEALINALVMYLVSKYI